MSNINKTVDITPTPRILRVLGEIPFLPWQCLAELIDNSIDAFLSMEESTDNEIDQRISVTWSGDNVGTHERTVEISDNACGMSLEQLQNSVRAGYSSNDPIGNLGLFGMGFNIATARLGELTTVLTTRKGDKNWTGLTIDFQKMNAEKSFEAPLIFQPKENPNESGTKIIIQRLRTGIRDELILRENDIRKQLETIYTPLLDSKDISIFVKGKQLFPRNHCIWAQTRYVAYNQQTVPAYVVIDRDLGHSLFDLERNCYLTSDEAEPYYAMMQRGESFPAHIVERSKRLKGWLGIQRYADPNDFGIDFVRNGRKILIRDKSLFQYDNPYTGQKELQYPLELGTTVGGRIVGELHVDYLLPTYQKNDFDKTDYSWAQTVEAICGVGPFLPKMRSNLGFTDSNTSPLGLLVNAYRRIDQGTKCLFAPNELAKRYAAEFRAGKKDYLTDDLWWKAAQEEDQKRSTGGKVSTAVDTGTNPSDDISNYLGGENKPIISAGVEYKTVPQEDTRLQDETSQLDDLLQRSNLVIQLSGKYEFGKTRPLTVHVYELKQGKIYEKGTEKPAFFASDGIDCTFVYDPANGLLANYPITAKMLLLCYLAEKLKARDSLTDFVKVYAELVGLNMTEAKLDRQSLQDRAINVFETVREKLHSALSKNAEDVLHCIHESSGEVEETVQNLLSVAAYLIEPFQNCEVKGYDALLHVPYKTLIRVVDKFANLVFDGVVFNAPYNKIKLSDENATIRSRNESKERLLSFLKDALRLTANSPFGQKGMKNELSRASLSIDFLVGELV